MLPLDYLGLDRNLATMFAAITGAGVGHNDSHRIFGNAERLRQLTSYSEGHLRTGPYR